MAQGYIQSIDEKNTKVGKMWDFTIDNRKIGAGKFPPKGFQAGDYVEYDVEERGNFLNLKAGSMKKLAAPAGTAPKPATAGGSSFQSYDAKQDVIARQAAANTAISLMQVMTTVDALPVPKTGKANKADIVEAIFREYTAKIYHMSTGKEYEDLDGNSSGPVANAEAAPVDNQSWDE